MSTFSLHLQLLNQQGLALPNFAVELWISDGPATDHVRTDAEGRCVICWVQLFSGQMSESEFAGLEDFQDGVWL